MKLKQSLLVTAAGVTLFAALTNLSAVLTYLGKGFEIILPILAGGIIALFLNVPMSGIEKWLKKVMGKSKRPLSDKTIRGLSFLLTLLIAVLILLGVLTRLGPELARSTRNLYDQVEAHIPQWLDYLDAQQFNFQWLEDLLSGIKVDQLVSQLKSGFNVVLPNVISVFASTVSGLTTAAFAVIIAIYMSLGKEQLCRHARLLARAYLKPSWADGLIHFCQVFQDSFRKFLTGQCLEAIILGVLMFLAFTVCRLPYASLVGVLTALCAIIPYVGAFLSCAISVFLIALVEPGLVVRCVIVYFAVQFVENQFIYPRVVGDSVGLPALYTLAAALIGGNLFGIMGILFSVPLMAVIQVLLREGAQRRLASREN